MNPFFVKSTVTLDFLLGTWLCTGGPPEVQYTGVAVLIGGAFGILPPCPH